MKKDHKKLYVKSIQEILPFIIGKAIILGFEDRIRFGKDLLRYGDIDCTRVYQVIFMEIFGFKVDQVYVLNWIRKHNQPDFSLDSDVVEFIAHRGDFLKEKAL